ncbi:tyrosine-type recombinase/integrase [Desulfonatronospira thiodismutans]|uniref:tyrosine-type recombinase/integrase n=1 Tax=Desulfonatronospira thiodismutans TaxID=488939 RepID=UPI0001975B11|nr:tyrosine-type recombinase/integrase [Desulfonatronospira thiodismutans]
MMRLFNLAERWQVIDKAPTRNARELSDPDRRERYLTDEELYRVLDALYNCRSTIVADIIRMLLLTGARKSEVVRMRWQELDMEKGFWRIPAARNKGNKYFSVNQISFIKISLTSLSSIPRYRIVTEGLL